MKKTKKTAGERIICRHAGVTAPEHLAYHAQQTARRIDSAIKRAVKAEAVRVATVAIKQLGIVSAGLWRVDDPTRLHLERAIDGAVDAVDGTITIHTKAKGGG